jgi:hypothetical protein
MRVTCRLVAVLLLCAAPLAADEFFVPMVAQKEGEDGAWWNTEVWVANTTASTASYGVVFLPAGKSNLQELREEVTSEDLAPGATVYRNDVVPQGAVGVLRVVASPGVQVYARVFNAAGRGSFGEGVPGLPRSAAIKPGEIGSLLGLRRTPQFRTNMFLFNPSVDNGTLRVRVINQRGEVVREEVYRAAPGGLVELDDVLHGFDVSRGENLRAEVTGTVPFFAFASVVDTRSGAPTLVQPLH